MITENKVRIYKQYDGDIDSWVRSGSNKEKLIMSDDDWFMIDSLIQDLALVKNGLASKDFNTALQDNLKDNCDNADTINQLTKIAEK